MKKRNLLLAMITLLSVITLISCSSKNKSDATPSGDSASYKDACFQGYEEYGPAKDIIKDLTEGIENEDEYEAYDVSSKWQTGWNDDFIEYYEEETDKKADDIDGKHVTLVLERTMVDSDDDSTVYYHLTYDDKVLIPVGLTAIYDGQKEHTIDEDIINEFIYELTAYSEPKKSDSDSGMFEDTYPSTASVEGYSGEFEEAVEEWLNDDDVDAYDYSWKTGWDDEFTEYFIEYIDDELGDEYTESELFEKIGSAGGCPVVMNIYAESYEEDEYVKIKLNFIYVEDDDELACCGGYIETTDYNEYFDPEKAEELVEEIYNA